MMAAVVAAMTLGELLGPAAGTMHELAVTDLISDSREVTAGSAFVAVAGGSSHGLEYAAQALQSGAAIVLYDPAESGTDEITARLAGPRLAVTDLGQRLGELGRRFYGRAEPAEQLIGITGTNGKTTVAWLVAQAMINLGRPCGYVGTLGHGLGDALEPQSLTTPGCLSLHRTLAALGTPNAVIEVSSHALAQDRVAGIDIPVGVFTNLSRDHLDWHGTMEAYFEAKASLFVRPGLRAAVINADDACAEALLGRLAPATRVVTVGLADAHASIRGTLVQSDLSGITLGIDGDSGKARLDSSLIGAFNAENLLSALGVLITVDTELDAACEALARSTAAPGRMEVVGGPPGPWVVVDFAHTPRALQGVLSELGTLDSGALTCVFGCGGERDRGKRMLMGQAAAQYAAHIVLTDDNPRSEDPAAIISDIKSGITRHPDLHVEHSRERAIREAIESAQAGDIVLIAGKGHESTQQTSDKILPFDDRVVARRVLEGLS